jgi:hypothetical protein
MEPLIACVRRDNFFMLQLKLFLLVFAVWCMVALLTVAVLAYHLQMSMTALLTLPVPAAQER